MKSIRLLLCYRSVNFTMATQTPVMWLSKPLFYSYCNYVCSNIATTNNNNNSSYYNNKIRCFATSNILLNDQPEEVEVNGRAVSETTSTRTTIVNTSTPLTEPVVPSLSSSSSSSSSSSKSSALLTLEVNLETATGAATPGGIDLTERYTHDIAELEHRRRTVTRATDEQRRGIEPLATRYKHFLENGEREESEEQEEKDKLSWKSMSSESRESPSLSQDQKQRTENTVITEKEAATINNKEEEYTTGGNSEQNKIETSKPGSRLSEMERWWSYSEDDDDTVNLQTEMYAGRQEREMKRYDGMFVPELKEVLQQDKWEEISYASELYGKPEDVDNNSSNYNCKAKRQKSFPSTEVIDEAPQRTKRLFTPPPFDPALDNIKELSGEDDFEDGYMDAQTMHEINEAAEADRIRFEALGNPLTMDKQIHALIDPSRKDVQSEMERKEFNGFTHWGLLHRANLLLTENLEFTAARKCVNEYLRDMDLFVKWLEHPKVINYMKKKFHTEERIKFDNHIATAMAFYTLGKIAVYEDNVPDALKSFHSAIAIIHETGNLSLDRHRRALGYNLLARGMIYCKLGSFAQSEEDLTRCIAFLQSHKFPVIYELRAEAREQLGNIDGAREDEEKAAELWEKGEVVCDPVTGEMRKLVYEKGCFA